MKNLLCKVWIITNVMFISFCQNPIVDTSNSINAPINRRPTNNIISTSDANTDINNSQNPSNTRDTDIQQMSSSIDAVNTPNFSGVISYPLNDSIPSIENIIITETGQAILDLSVADLIESGTNNNHVSNIHDGVKPIVTSKSDNKNSFLNESPMRDYEGLVGTGLLENSNSFVQLEHLSRNKRQATGTSRRRLNEAARNRVLLLTNRGSNETNTPRLDGRVIMLARPNNASSRGARHNSMMRLKPRDSIFDILQANGQNSGNMQLSEAANSQPAIQRISDLNSIELKSSEFSHKNSSAVSVDRNTATNNTDIANRLNGQQISTSQITRRPNIRGLTSTNRQRDASRRMSVNQGSQAGTQQNRRQPTRQLVSLRSSRQNSNRSGPRRTSNVLSPNRPINTNRERTRTAQNTRTRTNRPVQPRLAIQQPVSTRRIGSPTSNVLSISPNSRSTSPNSRSTSSNARSTSSRGSSNRPLVRTVSARNVRQQSSRNRASNPRQRSSGSRQQPRRQMVRRRQSPPDPFTQRFAAGFQRGSNLLHQPPLDFSSFNGTVRENVGFNGMPDIPGMPPMPPGMFGGFPFPGFPGFGPAII